MLLTELRNKDVVNEEDGSIIGRIVDVDIDLETGSITQLKVRNHKMFWYLSKERDIISIMYEKIIKIGSDVIIVDITATNN